MRIVVAPDSFGGTLSSPQVAGAIAEGWLAQRPQDEVEAVPLADGGEGTLEAVARPGDAWHEIEVADPFGRPRSARWLRRADGVAVIETAEACGLAAISTAERDPLRTTTYGVGQLLEAVLADGAEHVIVGLGGSATVDGGAGALTALGYRVTTEGGGGLKIGGRELERVGWIEPRWLDPAWSDVEVVLWADVPTVLSDAAQVFGPQKGATPEAVRRLRAGLEQWAQVVEEALEGRWRDVPGSGAAGGLAFGLLAGVGAGITAGADAVADQVGLSHALTHADLVITGEGNLDTTSTRGKVMSVVLDRAAQADVRVAAVVGSARIELASIAAVEESAPRGPGPRPAEEVAQAARRLAARAEGFTR